MNESGVYAIVNDLTGRPYIGETSCGFGTRWGQHLKQLERGKHSCKRLQADFNLFGVEAFSFQVLEIIDEAEPKYRQELSWLGAYGGFESCYNSRSY